MNSHKIINKPNGHCLPNNATILLDPNVQRQILEKCGLSMILKIIGNGGYSYVNEVKNRAGQVCALKITELNKSLPKEDFKRKEERVINEINLSLSIRNPYAIKTFSYMYGETDNVKYYCMLMEKASLTNIKKVYSLFKKTDNFLYTNFLHPFIFLTVTSFKHLATYLTLQIIQGVEFIHRVGIVHYDIKPENLLLSSNFRVKISDMNMSCKYNFKYNKTDDIIPVLIPGGTEQYVGNEFYRKEPIKLSNATLVDIFALSITIYYIFTKKQLIIKERKENSQFKVTKEMHEEIQEDLLNDDDLDENLRVLLSRATDYELSKRPRIYEFLDNEFLNQFTSENKKIITINEGLKEKILIEFQKKSMYNELHINQRKSKFKFRNKTIVCE